MAGAVVGARAARATLLAFAIGCTPKPVAPIATPAAGISIALYDRGSAAGGSYGVVDDRRWVEVAGKELVLDNIDPGAALASLAIESLDHALAITDCVRAAIPDPPPAPAEPKPAAPVVTKPRMRIRIGLVPAAPPPPPPPPPPSIAHGDRFDTRVRCTVAGAPGKHLIRILYVSNQLAYKGEHDVAMTASDHATVTSRFAFHTPLWHARAEVTLFDGVPGGERPPREVARGPVELDGSIAVIGVPARDVKARLRRIYDGAIATPELSAIDAAWNAQSTRAVWVWLELDALRLAPGPVRVHVELPGETIRDVEVPAAGRRQDDRTDAPMRLPVWLDEQLSGSRQRFADTGDAQLAERLVLSVANLGDVEREVWIEERVRPAKRRKVERAWPKKPGSRDDLVLSKVTIKPHDVTRLGYTIEYDF